MNRIINILILVFIFTISSCSQAQIKIKGKPKIIEVAVNENIQYSLLDILKPEEFIPLETNENVVIAGIAKLKISGNNFYIQDDQTKTLFVFNQIGQFIRKIGKHGRGPTEYLSLTDFDIMQDDSKIAILDNYGKQILIYDKDGKYIDRIKHNLWINSVSCLPNNKYIVTCTNNPNIDFYCNMFIINQKGDVIENLFPYPEELNALNFGLNNYFLKFNNELCFHFPFNDTLYSISGKDITRKYAFDFGSNKISKKYLLNNFTGSMMTFIEKISKTNKILLFNTFIETDEYLYFDYFQRGKIGQHVFYSKKTGNIKQYNQVNLHGFFKVFDILATQQDYLIGLIYPAYKDMYLKNLKNLKDKYDQDDYDSLEKICRQMKVSDNPILIRFKVRPF